MTEAVQTELKGILPDWRAYQPLIAISFVALLVSLVLWLSLPVMWMNAFMGMWLVLFALVKLFDITGFAEKFARYDVVTQYFKPYALAFPFIELGLGAALLAGFLPGVIYGAVLLLAAVTLFGVVRELRRKNRFECACMGSLLSVPLSTVTLLENGLMIVMSLAYLFV